MNKDEKIYIAGHKGMVGGALCRRFQQDGFKNLIFRSSSELDLRNQQDVRDFFYYERPKYVLLAAAKVGGIMANIESPATFLYDNLMIQNNVINSAYEFGVKKLLFLGSSCIYPRLAPQPMKEESLLDGKLEPTNEGYAIAKIAGMKLCEMYNRQYDTDYISVMPCNLYGIGDNFDPKRSHVVPALIRKFHEAKKNGYSKVILWGTGNAKREFLFSDDLADACLYLMKTYSGNEFFNVGTGSDIKIANLAKLVSDIIGYEGEIVFDTSKPDGMPQKLMDVSKLTNQGWKFKTSLERGIEITYKWYLENYNN
ncbi:GDP-L-fucose synthase [Eubacterium sp. MSJ-13]|uniref:GDP-L-fucose synthase family protein n=1 Tax=Eubacterium sp. MSJ-13 TaxID=2841513 RepID=UPI001C102488|nr:GDP-L-fucose synthase [Eubacterium sp. MSJ-13]